MGLNMLSYTICYTWLEGCVKGWGKLVSNEPEFNSFLVNSVQARLRDEEVSLTFESDLSALVSTDMAVDTLKRIINAPAPDPEPWEIGEALAECVLQDEYNIKWPWNKERDKRTPKASLPGADLIGFIEIGNTIMFALGEVKTSADLVSPPRIMHGRSGMIHQLDKLANNLQIHRSLIKWLLTRCKNTDFWPLFQEAVINYLNSGGKIIALFGILLRDTAPNQLDLKGRVSALSAVVQVPTNMDLCAWYLPSPISKWPSLVVGM